MLVEVVPPELRDGPVRLASKKQKEFETVPYDVLFTEEGHLDLDSMLESYLYNFAKIFEMDPRYIIRKPELDGKYKTALLLRTIKTNLHTIPDILEMFDLDGEMEVGETGEITLPLKMKGSGFKLRYTPQFNEKGLDTEHLLNVIEEAYKEVLNV